MDINKKVMEQEARSFLATLFSLPEVEKVQIKEIFISSADDDENILKGLELCYHDKYSDVDINAYLRLQPEDFNAETPFYKRHFSRLALKEKIFGIAFQPRIGDKEGMRICLKTGVRIDFACFCKCDEFAPLLIKGQTTIKEQNRTFWGEWDLEKADWFWFVAIQALGKLMRKDYLISSHLAHTLIMEGLVAQMIMRDNQYNTNFHRYGYAENLEYLAIDMIGANEFKISKDETYNYIVELLYQAVVSYDKLISDLNSRYECRCGTFFEIWRSYISDYSTLTE